MGLFDNVNWQQVMPALMGGMAAGAAYGDPASGPALAHGGWNAVQTFMQQQRMQQQKEEFDQRQKQLDKELGMREKYLKIAETRAAKEGDEDLQDQYINSRMPEIFAMLDKDPETPLSAIWNRLNDEKKGSIKLDFARFGSMAKQFEFTKTKEGPVMTRFNNGKLELYREVTGGTGGKKIKPVTLAEGLTPDVIEQFKNNPVALKQLAKQARDGGEPAVASYIEGWIPKPVKDLEKAKFSLDATNKEWGIWWDAHKKEFDVDPYSGDYPGNKYPMEAAPKPTEKGFAEYKKKHDEYNALKEEEKNTVMKAFSDRIRAVSESITREDVDAEMPTATDPYTPPSGYENSYKAFMRMALDRKMTGPPAVAWARAATAKAVQIDEAQSKTTETRKRKVSEKPVPSGGRTPVSTPYEQQRQAWQANPNAPMPGPLIPPGPMAAPIRTPRMDEEVRQQMMRRLGGFM